MATTDRRTHYTDEAGINKDVLLAPSDVIGSPYEVEMKVANITLTNAQILALQTTPIQVIAAPGAGKAIIVARVLAEYNYLTAAFANIAAGDDLNIRYTDGSGNILTTLETTGWLDQTTNQVRVAFPTATGGTNLTPIANAAVVASLGGAIDTGLGSIDLRIYYFVIPTTL